MVAPAVKHTHICGGVMGRWWGELSFSSGLGDGIVCFEGRGHSWPFLSISPIGGEDGVGGATGLLMGGRGCLLFKEV